MNNFPHYTPHPIIPQQQIPTLHQAALLSGRLTPRECWRLQAVDDELFDRARKVCSDSQLYKQAGNGVTVSVVYAIAKELLNKNPHIEENLNRQEATL